MPYRWHFGVFAAEAKGFYRDAGIDIEIQRGYGPSDTVKRVATRATNWHGRHGFQIIGRGNGLTVKQVEVVLDKSADAIFYLKGIGIEKPEQLAERTLGAAVGETSLNLFPGFASGAGLDFAKLRLELIQSEKRNNCTHNA